MNCQTLEIAKNEVVRECLECLEALSMLCLFEQESIHELEKPASFGVLSYLVI